MAQLSIALFGPFQATLKGGPVRFESDKVRALLAYLVAEAGTQHRREKLAGLLWPGWSESSARNNLRHTLAVLRRAIGDRDVERPALSITRQTVQFCTESDTWADVTAFASLLQAAHGSATESRSLWEQAVDLYQGDFLQDFSLPDSPEFEAWATLSREQFRRQAMDTLNTLAESLEQRGEIEHALQHARRQTELDPWREEAHRQIMRLLALSGRRSEALAQYQTCQRILAEELGVEPSAETTRLYEQIRDGALETAVRTGEASKIKFRQPAFLEEQPDEAEIPVFVARERELSQLGAYLDLALAGQGRVVFVTGEAGSGKTALLQEFAGRALGAHPSTSSGQGLVVAGGHGNAQTGIGDPYLPFREILDLLTGDVQAQWAAGAMSLEQARRLWATLPHAVQALIEVGPDLIDTFVLRSALQKRTALLAPDGGEWQARLDERAGRRPAGAATGPQQTDLFEQYTRVLQALARQCPLLLMLDDLQWADLGSISLLFHLGRQLAGSPILIVGAYRPEELSVRSQPPAAGAGQDDRHPLEAVVHELQRIYGDITVNLGQAESRYFVDALLDAEPNRLGTAFREMLYRQTRGHPLFTVELLRGLQEQGDLVQDSEGWWMEGPALNWERLPARVEAVIAERMARLARPLRSALQVACVEGQVFSAEVVAQVLDREEREIVRQLSSALDRRHRLVRAQSLEVVGPRRISRYRFRHSLFQKYLYDGLDQAERAYLHEDIGNLLEAWYGDQAGDIAVELARHFQEARNTEKAIRYLHQAGDRAVHLSAYEEGSAQLREALAVFLTLPAPISDEQRLERARQELGLQISLALALKARIPATEGEMALARARDLCYRTGETAQLSRIVGELSIPPFVRAEYQKALQLSEEALRLAQEDEDPLLVTISHWHLGYILFGLGEYKRARYHLLRVISFYKPQLHHRPLVILRGSDPGVSALAYDACCLWCLGYPEQAEARSREALSMAHVLDHAFSLADVICQGGCVFNRLRRNAQMLSDMGQELAQLSARMGFTSFGGTGTCYWGEGLVGLGQVQEGLVQIREGLTSRESLNTRCFATGILSAQAEAEDRAGSPEKGLIPLARAFNMVAETGERYCEAELNRIEGQLRLALGTKPKLKPASRRVARWPAARRPGPGSCGRR